MWRLILSSFFKGRLNMHFFISLPELFNKQRIYTVKHCSDNLLQQMCKNKTTPNGGKSVHVVATDSCKITSGIQLLVFLPVSNQKQALWEWPEGHAMLCFSNSQNTWARFGAEWSITSARAFCERLHTTDKFLPLHSFAPASGSLQSH